MFKRIDALNTIAALSIASFMPSTALAEPYGYIGAGYGQYKFEFEDDDNGQKFSDKNTLGKIFIGAQANDVLGAEITYLSFSDGKDKLIKSEIEGGKSFAEAAMENSSCPSGKNGGDLGEFGPGQMVPEFDKVVFSAPVNSVQGPVKTQFGYHLLEVTSRED